jgi:ABC-type glycerol-3-phosphate transport system substrate-binding protein
LNQKQILEKDLKACRKEETKMKKNIFWILSMILLGSLLVAGCQSAAETTVPEEGEGEPAEMETVTITIWDFGGQEFSYLDEIAIPEFEEKFPHIKINHVGVLEDELGLKIETAIAAGEVPDIALFVPTRVVAAGHVLALDDYMARDGIAREDYCSLFQSGNISTYGQFDDEVTSLPIDTNIWAMVYNKDLFAEAGLPELGTDDYINFETWLEYSRAINNPSEDLEERVWGSNMFVPVFNSQNNYMSSPFALGDDGRSCEGNANNADWMNAWDIMMTAYDENITPESAGIWFEELEEDMFVQGKMGMTYSTLGDVVYTRDQGLNVGLTGQPVVTEDWSGNVGGWNNSYSIMAASEHPDEAWEFLKFLSTEAPLNVPLGSDMLLSDEAGLPGLPCYLPLHEQGRIAEMIAEDPLVADSVELMSHIVPPPFTPDTWTSFDEFWNVFSLVEDEGMTVEEAVNEATVVCQDATDELWEVFDSIGQ